MSASWIRSVSTSDDLGAPIVVTAEDDLGQVLEWRWKAGDPRPTAGDPGDVFALAAKIAAGRRDR